MSSAASSTPSSPSLGSPIRFGSYEFTPHSDSSRSTFSDLQGNMEMTFGSVHYNVNSEGILRLLEPLASISTGPSASSSTDLSTGLTDSANLLALSTPRSTSSMSVGSDDPASSEMTSYYCLHCDTRHELGSNDTLFICNAQYSSGEDIVDSIVQALLKDSARAWLRGLPKGSIKSWDDLVDAFVANFQATYKRPVGIEELRHCQQKQKESMCAYIGRFTKLLNAAEDVSVDRAIDAFSDGIRRESYIEELGRKKPKTITKLMEIANSWADGEDNVRRPRQRSDDEDDDQPKHDSGERRDRHKKRKNHSYDDSNLVAAGYSDRQDDRDDDRRDDRQDGNRNNSGNRGNYKPRPQRTPELPFAEQINAPCYLHSYIDSKDNKTKSSHLLRDCRQFLDMEKLIRQKQQQPPPPPPPQHQVQQAQPHQPNETFPPPRGQMSMIHRTGVSRREMKKLTREINLAESIMANIPEYVEWSSQNITFSRADHPMTIPKPGHAALVVEAQIGGFKMSKVFMDGGSGINLIFVDTIKTYAKFMDVPHYAYLKLKMPGNNGTNITVYGSFSRSDNCDRDFQRIAAKFGLKQEIADPPPKLSLREIKEEKHVREIKKKPADLAPEASAAKASAVDSTVVLRDGKTLAIAVETPSEVNDASKTANVVDKPEDKKNPFLA
ncbi:hypothetical protein QYE76_034620 [Lolium multiflorum]|uniref:Retrotransposon gag domain-containing protein n=1 Tax=Lolium multiflorum TaxID=4521 RepID=A0AAD8QZH2_LOLMU|nr:hypothetical protein QYE76_034620 [Lolium multiflorum]